LNCTASLDAIGGTPGTANSVMGQELDTKPPRVDSLIVVNNRELRIYFNELMDSLSLSFADSYSIESSHIHPSDVLVSGRSATLWFSTGFINAFDDHLMI